jgi:molecular chaperone DnaK (HSP70)
MKHNTSKMEAMSNLTINDRKLVVGVDFGTTFSGVAWAETRRVSNSKKAPEGTSNTEVS